MNCTTCGQVNQDGARFCQGCGRPLGPETPGTAQGVAPGAGAVAGQPTDRKSVV